jgi:hypothetical protein
MHNKIHVVFNSHKFACDNFLVGWLLERLIFGKTIGQIQKVMGHNALDIKWNL